MPSRLDRLECLERLIPAPLTAADAAAVAEREADLATYAWIRRFLEHTPEASALTGDASAPDVYVEALSLAFARTAPHGYVEALSPPPTAREVHLSDQLSAMTMRYAAQTGDAPPVTRTDRNRTCRGR